MSTPAAKTYAKWNLLATLIGVLAVGLLFASLASCASKRGFYEYHVTL